MDELAVITEAIAATSVQVVGMSPGVGVAYVYQSTAQALGNAANNATSCQQNGNILDHATTATGAALIASLAPKG